MAKKSKSLTEKSKLVKFTDRYELDKALVVEQIDNLAAQTELLRAQAADVVARTARENKQYS